MSKKAQQTERQQEATAAARIAAATLLDAYATAEGISPADVTPEQSAAVEIIPEADRPAGYTTATEYDRATVDAMTECIAQAAADDMPTGEAPVYQRYELEAYLGEYVEDYDVNAIEHDATAYDPATGRTVWAVDAETLAVIAERHQLQFYAPAF